MNLQPCDWNWNFCGGTEWGGFVEYAMVYLKIFTHNLRLISNPSPLHLFRLNKVYNFNYQFPRG